MLNECIHRLTDRAELLKRDLSVAVRVSIDDRLVDDLLKLRIFEIVADHHLEHLEQLAIRNIAVTIDVIDLKRN